MTVKTYEFTTPARLRFYGNRWDGHEVLALRAPVAVWIAPDGTIVEEVEADAFGVCAGWTRYERQSSFVPPIHYVFR